MLLGICGLLLGAGLARAESPEIVVVDARQVLNHSAEGKQANKALRDLIQQRKGELRPLEEELKKKQEEFEKQRWVWRPELTSQKQVQLVKLQSDFERAASEAEDGLEVERRKLMQPILKKIDEVVRTIGDTEGYTLIVEKNSPLMLYFDDALEITDRVIEAVNEKE